LICNAEKVTEGVTPADATDSPRDRDVVDADSESDDTDTRTAASQSSPSQSRTHEKADMAVVSAAYPGELCSLQYECICVLAFLTLKVWATSEPQ